MSAAFQTYDFTLAAGGSQRIPVSGKYVRVQTAIGKVNLRGDFGVLRNLSVGQGQTQNNFTYVTVEDASGAANAGSIIVGDSGFIDNQMILASSSAIALDSPTLIALTRPQANTGFWNDNTSVAANSALQAVAPASNPNGMIILQANIFTPATAVGTWETLCHGTAAPTSILTNANFLVAGNTANNGSAPFNVGNLPQPVFIPAGHGIWYINNSTVASSMKTMRFKTL